MYSIKLIDNFPFAQKNIENITSNEIQQALNSLTNYSESTIKKVTGLLNKGFFYALNKGYIVTNPMADILRPKSKKKEKNIRPLTVEEQEQFTNYLKNAPLFHEPLKLAYLIEMYLGLRIGETLALRNCDIDLENNIININKTLTIDKQGKIIMGNITKTYSGEREVPIPNFLIDDVIHQMELAKNNKDNLLFVDTKGGIMNPKNANRQLKNILKLMGIKDVSTHTLRHTYATRSAEAKMPDFALKDLMGHKDISITKNFYTTASRQYKQDETNKLIDYYINNNIIDTEYTLRLIKGKKKDEKEEKEIG